MASFLFVHGAFQGGWVWRNIRPLLHNRGHAVHTPTLSGCGYLFSGFRPELDLTTYVKDMASYLDIEDLDEVVLVGHSYSGMICGALMMLQPQRIRQAIFVDAVIPQSNRSFVDIAGKQFEQMLTQHRLDNELIRPWPVQVFGIDGPKAAWFESRLRPFPQQAFHTGFPGRFDPAIRPISYITCRKTMSPFIREAAQKAAELSWPVHELDSAHCPMLACPEALTELLATIAQPGDTSP